MADFDHTLAPHEVRRIAADAFVFGFPLMLVDLVRRAHPVGANQILHLPDNAPDVAPGLGDGDPHMVQSTAWIDLAEGPMIASLPPVEGRHLSVTLIDAWGEMLPGVDSALAEGRLVIVGPEWLSQPGGISWLRVGTNAVWMVTRLVAVSMADREIARGLLARQRIAPLQGANYATFAPPVLEPPIKASVEAIASLTPEIFFHRLAVLLGRHPPAAIREGLEACAQMGLAPGQPYAPPPTASQAYQAATRGLSDGLGRIKHAASSTQRAAGWRRLHAPSARRGALDRAANALTSLGAAADDSILHLLCEADSEGWPLSGAERYECRFPAGHAPPAEAFWSLSLRRRPPHGELLLHRYALSGHDRPRPEPNGDLKLLIQHAPPSSEQAANWLPSPLGEFALVLRLYAPGAAALDGSWTPPPLQRIEPSPRLSRRSG